MVNTEQYSGGYAKHTLNEFFKRSLDKEGLFFKDYIVAGQTVLDVGCGPGSLSLQLAGKVGASGLVHAVDIQSEQFPTDHPENIQFKAASIYELPFATSTFDAILAHAVLYHIDNQHAALMELKRVLKPGGLLGIRDADFAGDVYFPEVSNLDLAWKIIEACFENTGSDLFFGRKQSSYLKKAGFDVVKLSASYDIFCDPVAYSPKGFALFWQEYMQRLGARSGYTADQINKAQVAIESWGNHPDAYYGRTRCEAVARKPQ
ncbi:MAG: methyltransferase domain-containing protein [Methylococcales bacterium]